MRRRSPCISSITTSPGSARRFRLPRRLLLAYPITFGRMRKLRRSRSRINTTRPARSHHAQRQESKTLEAAGFLLQPRSATPICGKEDRSSPHSQLRQANGVGNCRPDPRNTDHRYLHRNRSFRPLIQTEALLRFPTPLLRGACDVCPKAKGQEPQFAAAPQMFLPSARLRSSRMMLLSQRHIIFPAGRLA